MPSNYIKRGTPVAQIATVVRGDVTGYEFDKDSGERMLLVTWKGADGNHAKFFKEGEVITQREEAAQLAAYLQAYGLIVSDPKGLLVEPAPADPDEASVDQEAAQ